MFWDALRCSELDRASQELLHTGKFAPFTSMKTFGLFLLCALSTSLCCSPAGAAEKLDSAPPNQLTAEEKAAGWKLLFDGKTLNGWRNFKKPAAPTKGWGIEDGWLKLTARSGGGDIITVDQFSEFELTWDWRIPAKANNGLKYFITEERASAVGHEYQLIDDSIVKNGDQRTGSFYDVLPPKENLPSKPPGQINHSRILVRGNHVEHWLNGEKVLEYELGSDQVKAAVAKSKFKDVPGFGTRIKGHILLTDHRDEASFRNIKIRDLSAK
jgi:hypothetical protein